MRAAFLSLIFVAAMPLAVAVHPRSAAADQPITTDSRIKTLVYNPNEVFSLVTHYGYQSNIEFGARETIDMISVGDRIAWQISPAGRRLFIRAQEENAHTNMTVVTNLRAYQFDLRSSAADAVFGSEELTYVVRFFYPEEGGDHSGAWFQPPGALRQASSAQPVSAAVTIAPPAPTAAAPIYNYRYTYSGADSVAPVKIFDDGKNTYFKFSGAAAPQVAIITARGESLDIPTRVTPDGLITVNAVAPRFSIRQSGQQVVVYNEAGGAL